MPATADILIMGDGIAGRAMALACGLAGRHAKIIAPANNAAPNGGVQLAPNGWAALDALGTAEAAKTIACPLTMMRLLSTDTGNTLVGIDLTAAHRRPYAGVNQAGLMDVLKSAATTTGHVSWHDGRAQSITSHDDHAAITLEDGTVMTAPFIIGADGADGLARSYVQAAASPRPLTETRRAFRCTIPLADLPPHLHATSTSVWLGDGGHMVFYPLPPLHHNTRKKKGTTATINNQGMLNLVAVTTAGTSARRQALALAKAQPILSALIPHVETAHDMPLYRHPILDVLRRGRVILTGDAAHPMPPHLAQGAGQSLIDAASILPVLTAAQDDAALNTALTTWTAARLKATKRIQEKANRAGKLFALDGPLTKIRNIGLASIGGVAMVRELDRIWQS